MAIVAGEPRPVAHSERRSEEVGLDTADKQNVLQQAQDNNVQFIRMWFTDILGTLKSFAITVEELEDALDGGMGFDGSSITGYQDIE
jgi:glutamine synthetase